MEVVRNFSKLIIGYFSNKTLINYIAIFSVFIILIFSLKPRNASFNCLLSNEKIFSMEGTVVSNPVITSSRKYYKCEFSPNLVYNEENSIYSSKGKLNLLIPTEIVESHYPGKLYSKSGKTIFVENGANLLVNVKPLDNSQDNIFIVNKTEFLGWNNYISKIRGFFRLQFKRILYLWGSAGGLLLALLSASKEYTSVEFSNAFRLAGLSHILALSGMHVSIFSSLTESIFIKFLGKNKTKLLCLLSILLFVWFAGISPSLSRAMLSSIIIYIFFILNIKINIIDILSLSFIIQLLIFPQDSSSISFILSYLALLGILTLGEFIKPHLNKLFGTYMSNALSSSIGAVIFTSPVSAIIWGYITPIGIISTIFISPLVTFFLIFGLISIIVCLIFPFFTYPLGTILQIVYYCIENLATFFSKVPPLVL